MSRAGPIMVVNSKCRIGSSLTLSACGESRFPGVLEGELWVCCVCSIHKLVARMCTFSLSFALSHLHIVCDLASHSQSCL